MCFSKIDSLIKNNMAIGKKTGGRKKNTLNRIPTDTRLKITDFLNDKLDEVFKEFDNLEIKDKIDLLKNLLPYSVPRLNATLMKIDEAPKETPPKICIYLDGKEIDLS